MEGNVKIRRKVTERQFNKNDFAKNRDDCYNRFVEIFGFDPVTIVDKRAVQNASLRFADPLKKRIVY